MSHHLDMDHTTINTSTPQDIAEDNTLEAYITLAITGNGIRKM